ncbi:putative RING-box protein 2-like isoform 2 [Scophthalmus maximus]|uniref:Putative RING-box protein 2-like isoform 2 n=1 Tax=Scophthalmus maximus TaxID=52904 RepID=A0A2U9B5X6_SCOMX|nr:putative RING-box protein 2-like isoform 2 [Scophthalmus maximus]
METVRLLPPQLALAVALPSCCVHLVLALASPANVTPLQCRAAEMDDGEEPGLVLSHNTHNTHNTSSGSKSGGDKMFSLKKWNAVAMWSWDVECDTCAICRVQVMGECRRLDG